MRSEELEEEGFYLYGIVEAGRPFPSDLVGLGGRPVSLILYKNLAAVVSPSFFQPYPVDQEHAFLHEGVVEKVMAFGPILPMRFNTLLSEREHILFLLREHYDTFTAQLHRFQGKVEMGLKVLWDPEPVKKEFQISTRGIRFLGKEAQGPGRGYLLKRLEAHRIAEAVRERGEALIGRIQAAFAPLAVGSVVRRFPTERLLLDASYLVKEEDQEAFRAGLGSLGVEMPELSFLLTGPWPPYSFVPCSTFEVSSPSFLLPRKGGRRYRE